MTSRKPHQFHLATVLSARGSYVALILIATIIEVLRYPDVSGALARLRSAVDPGIGWGNTYDALRNVLLFAGLGAIWLVTSPPTRLREAVWRGTAVGFALSLSVEALQVFTAARVASVLDVFTNSFGTSAGALGAGLLVAAVRAKRGHRTTLGVPFFLFAIGHLGALLSEMLAPLFGSARLAGMVGGPRARLAKSLAAAAAVDVSRLPLLDLVLALPAGAFSQAALVEFGVPRWISVVVVAIGAGSIATLVQVSHGMAGVAVNWNAAVAVIAGLALGAVLGAMSMPVARTIQGVRRARLIAVITTAAVLLWCWRPYILRASAGEILDALADTRLRPLSHYPYTDGLVGVAQVLQLASLGLLVGALLAVWPLRARGPLGYVWPAAILAAIVEAGHALIAGRIVDVTGFLILFAGAWLGDAVVRRAGFTRYGEMLDSSAFPVSSIPLAGPHRR